MDNQDVYEAFAILNSVRPPYERLAYPYTPLTKPRLVFTEAQIDLLVRSARAYASQKEADAKGGNPPTTGGASGGIVIYG
jgi:hypothetical protein